MSHWPQQSVVNPEQKCQYVTEPFQFSPPLSFAQPSQIVTPIVKDFCTPVGPGLRQLKPRLGPSRQSHRAPADAIDVDGKEHIKGRKRPLSPNSRATALRVRIIGACARCHEKHEQVR